MVKILSLVHGFFHGIRDFGTVVKISKMTNAVDDQEFSNAWNYQTFQKLISTDRRMILRIMEEELEISREAICKILVEDLGKREICARIASHSLVRVQAYQEFIQYMMMILAWLNFNG
jgi:hypothetical protein